ncbi:MAG: HAD-IB family phosphatase [Chitinophagales bacterium]|nr:HAD-IB family phosphatase [Chitinophagales bacterium]
MENSKWDVFICHAGEDKSDVVQPLTIHFKEAGITYWLDEGEILWGDSIITKINEGLVKSRYVLVVLSDASVNKNWPLFELNAMMSQEAEEGNVKILPLLKGTDEVIKSIRSKMILLRNKSFLKWKNNPAEIVHALQKRLGINTSPAQSQMQDNLALQASATEDVNTLVVSKAATTPKDWLKYKLVAFDLDGTLLKGYTFSWTLIWEYLKYPRKLQKTGMQRYRAGKTTYKQWCDWAVNLFMEKNLRREDFSAITQQVTLTKNFMDTIKLLKQEGIILAIISGGIDTFLHEKIPDAEKLFDYIFINKLQFDEDGRLSGVTTTDYDFKGKATALELICRVNGIDISESVFIGEGFNDEDIASAAGLCIAYPPSTAQGVSQVADEGIEDDDLSKIIEFIIGK